MRRDRIVGLVRGPGKLVSPQGDQGFESLSLRLHLAEASYGGRNPLYKNHIYIFICNDGKSYIGCTQDLKDKTDKHQQVNIPAIKDRIPIK